MSYEPHPSTLAYRAIQYLKDQPAGKSVASGPLADALGQPSSAVITSLTRCVEQGLVAKTKINGLFHWSIGDGVALAKPTDEDDDEGDATAPPPAAAKAAEPVPPAKPTGPVTAQITDDTRWGAQAENTERQLAEVSKPKAKRAGRARAPGVDVDRAHPKASTEKDAAVAVAAPFRFSWSSDGDLTVSKDGASVVLSPADLARVREFLNVVAALDAGSERRAA